MAMTEADLDRLKKELDSQMPQTRHPHWWRDYLRRALHDGRTLDELAIALWHKHLGHDTLAVTALQDAVNEAITETTHAALEDDEQ